MLLGKPIPMIQGQTLADYKDDYRTAEKIGHFRVSPKAVYTPDGHFILRSSIVEAVSGWGSAHVTGCCAGGIPTPRILFVTPDQKIPVLCDKEATSLKLAEVLNAK